MTRDRLHKGDRIVTTSPIFGPRAVGTPGLPGMIPTGTTGTVDRGGRFNAQVTWDHPDVDGNDTYRGAVLPYVTQTIRRYDPTLITPPEAQGPDDPRDELPTEADMQAGMPGQVRQLTPPLSALDAATDVARLCYGAFGDNAERFTCDEIDAIAALYRALGKGRQAETLLEMHAVDDEDGDDHVGYTAQTTEEA